MPSVTLFAGPSAHGLNRARLLRGGTVLRPPVRRGDVDSLVAEVAPGIVVLCDGVFQSEPAVAHAEICRALDAGWLVWGVSSLGAIRAHEMRAEGMVGFGWVYEQFSRHEDFTDDEMCLLHLPIEPYLPVTEALVNLRYALETQGPALNIKPRAARVLIASLRELWFGERSHERMLEVMLGPARIDAEAARRLLAWTKRHRIKRIDLARLMQERPWEGR